MKELLTLQPETTKYTRNLKSVNWFCVHWYYKLVLCKLVL